MARALSVRLGKGAVRSWASCSRDETDWRGKSAACASGAEKSRQSRQSFPVRSAGIAWCDTAGVGGVETIPPANLWRNCPVKLCVVVAVASLGIVGRLLKPNASTEGLGLEEVGTGGGDCMPSTEAGFGGIGGLVGNGGLLAVIRSGLERAGNRGGRATAGFGIGVKGGALWTLLLDVGMVVLDTL